MTKKPNPITFTVFEEFLPTELSKSQRRRVEIIEAAIRLCTSEGVDNFTYEGLAKQAQASRRLVQHYFPDRNELILSMIKYIRGRLQRHAIDAIQLQKGAKRQLKAYVDSVFDWTKKYPDDARVWLLFFYYCSFRENYLTLNTELVNQGHQRICALLKSGVDSGEFKVKRIADAAKLIQITINGAMLESITEREGPGYKALQEATYSHCLAIAKGTAKF